MKLSKAARGREHLAPKPVRAGTAYCQVGVSKRDITPEVGIHSRSWGAAASDVATGVHQPIYVSAMAFAETANPTVSTTGDSAGTLVLVTVDLGWLQDPQTDELHQVVAAEVGVPADNVLIQLSHTHASVSLPRAVTDESCPGRKITLEWWEKLKTEAAAAAASAVATMAPCWVTAAEGSCDLAQKRDLWDRAADGYVTAYNPQTHGEADKTVVALRVTAAGGDRDGATVATLCNYGCHPTSLGHPSTLISPDYPGACRDQIDAVCGGTCVFVLGACGETMPVMGHQGNPEVTERDGQKLGLAAAAAIAGLPKPGHQLTYSGPIVSGAVIGAWSPEPLPAAAVARAQAVRSCTLKVLVPIRKLESVESATAVLAAAEAAAVLAASAASPDPTAVRDTIALAEQARRSLTKLKDFGSGSGPNISVHVWQLGDIFVVATPGEPYEALQVEIRNRAPAGVKIIVAAMTNGSHGPGYILPSGTGGVGCGCYQDRIALLGAGALELLISAASAKITEWCFADGGEPPAMLL